MVPSFLKRTKFASSMSATEIWPSPSISRILKASIMVTFKVRFLIFDEKPKLGKLNDEEINPLRRIPEVFLK